MYFTTISFVYKDLTIFSKLIKSLLRKKLASINVNS